MKLLIIYRPNSEHGRAVESFVRDYTQHHDDNNLQVLNIDSREGWATASLYDVMQYPAIIVTREDGSIVKDWEGSELPQLDEVAGYVLSPA